jgi:hypothetical protein
MFIRRASAILVVAFTLAGCGGASDRSASDHATTSARRSTTTVAPTTTTTVPPPYSFDNSVQPPKLINTGTDYASIARSLDDYGHWLYAHHPDPGLVEHIAVNGSMPYKRMTDDLKTIATRSMRIYETASILRSSVVVNANSRLVSLRMSYTDDRRVLVDHTSKVVDQQTLPSPSTMLVVLSADRAGLWRFAQVDPAEPDAVTP